MSNTFTPIHCKWQMRVNGKTALNGRLYGAAFEGECDITEPDLTVYDALAEMIEHVRERNQEMQIVDAVQITFVLNPAPVNRKS